MKQIQSGARREWKRRVLSFILAAVMLLGLVPGIRSGEASAHWADPYLSQLREWGFIRENQVNNPDRALTRADFMGIVNRAYGYHETGETPFEDVKETDWFYDDVGIAYTAKYILGTSPTTASPNEPLTRETATTILGRNMMLQESPGELVEFTDSHRISTWAAGTIKSSLEHYLVSGYDDGTFRPQRNVSWGEMASMLTNLIGTPLQEPGDYSLGGVYGNVTITSPDVTLRDTVISGDLYISGGVGLGGIKLENVTVLGRIIASGTGNSEGGDASILLRNVTADEMLVDNLQGNYVSVRADGITEIGMTTVRTSAYIEDNTPEGLGLHNISLEGESYPEGEEPDDWEPIQLDLAGRIQDVVNRTPGSQVHVGAGTVEKLTVDEAAVGSSVVIDRGAVVKELNLETATPVTGQGDIGHLVVNAPGCEIEMLPDTIDIRPGLTAVIAGEEMDTVAAQESSEQPRILAGYPQAQDVIPTGLDAAFMTNKAGTIYWAVTAITDGSVGEEDLIKPPSYGSLAVAHGTASVAKGNEEVISKVTGLLPGGSYYLSAILVDGRGQRSPVKVIAFTTPDNTTPAFCSGYPKMSKVSRSDSVVVVMPNKDCKLYYALLPQGAAAPTETELKTNAVSGALGYGVRDVTKNEEDAFRVNDVLLEEQVTYVLYLWLVDANGVNKSAITSLTFTTADETPPEFIVEPNPTKIQATSVTLTFQLNENGTVYWVAVPTGTVYPKAEPQTDFEYAPPNSMFGKLQIANGMNIGSDGKAGKVTARENANGTITVSGLKAETAYDFYYVAQDTAGNYSEVWKKITINTEDNSWPVVTQSFEVTSDPNDNTKRPTSDSDIYLDISEDVQRLGKDGGVSFRQLYADASASGASAAAVNLWAQSLYNSIKLHKLDGSTSKEVDSIYTQGAAFTDDITIDYTKAYITTNPNNPTGIRIVFPNEGLNLEGGARYCFTVSELYDTSNKQNQIDPDPVNFMIPARRAEAIEKGHSVEPFDVAPPTVWMFTDPGVSAGKGPYDRKDSGEVKLDDDGNPIPETPDRYFRIDPRSTGNANESMSYDILMWSSLAATDFSLYYRVIDPENGNKPITQTENNKTYYPETYTRTNSGQLSADGTGIEDYLILPNGTTSYDEVNELVDDNGWIWLGIHKVDNLPAGGWGVSSLNQTFNKCDPTNFPLLKNLSDQLEYEFVISLERFRGSTDRDVWSGEVDFQFDVIAGQSSVLEQVASSLKSGRESIEKKYFDNGLATNIGWWDQEAQETLELDWSRLAIGMPGFDSNSPTFTNFTHESVDLNVLLTSEGTIHYVVDEAKSPSGYPAIPTTRKVTDDEFKLIAEKIDAGDIDESIWANKQNKEIYIGFEDLPEGEITDSNGDTKTVKLEPPPLNGIQTMPGWMVGTDTPPANTGDADDPQGKNVITNPNFDKIVSYRDLWDSTPPVAHNSFPAGTSVAAVETIKGLKPNTDYYIYMVIDNNAGSTSHGYIYHFKTEKTPKPKINIRPETSNGTADVWTPNADSNMRYILIEEQDAWRNNILNQSFKDFVAKDLTIPACWGTEWVWSKTDSRDKVIDEDGNPAGIENNGFTVLDALQTEYSYAAAMSSSNGDDAYKPLAQDGTFALYDGGYSVFDIYANDDIRAKVDDLIRKSVGVAPSQIITSGDWSYSVSADKKNLDISQYVGTSKYVLLVAGQRTVLGADDPIVDSQRDSFKANWNISKDNGEGPVLTDAIGASIKNVTEDEDDKLTSDAEFDFSVILIFDKPVYDKDRNQIDDLGKVTSSSPDGFNVSAVAPGDGAGSQFTLTGESLKLGVTFSIMNDGSDANTAIWSYNHNPAKDRLTIELSAPDIRITDTETSRKTEQIVKLTIKWGNKVVGGYDEKEIVTWSKTEAKPITTSLFPTTTKSPAKLGTSMNVPQPDSNATDRGDGGMTVPMPDSNSNNYVPAHTTQPPNNSESTGNKPSADTGTSVAPSLTLSPAVVTMMAGGRKALTAKATGGVMSGVKWTVTPSDVVTVTGSGSEATLTAKSIGTATVTATATVNGRELTQTSQVIVTGALKGVKLTSPANSSNVTMSGSSLTLKRGGATPKAVLEFTASAGMSGSAKLKAISVTTPDGKDGSKYLSITSSGKTLTVQPGSASTGEETTLTVTVGITTGSGSVDLTPGAADKLKFTVNLSGNDSKLNIGGIIPQ